MFASRFRPGFAGIEIVIGAGRSDVRAIFLARGGTRPCLVRFGFDVGFGLVSPIFEHAFLPCSSLPSGRGSPVALGETRSS
ncbi:hypothetical protein L842_5316 [Mycobacterium intracellulare MIN_052511_1280]|nr:hypothetical protein L842_5316 [Mycobacterium intracellulare MIN_052511_1280]